MREEDARATIAARWGAAALERLTAFVDALVVENERQNLIARSTVDDVWQRHVLDSAQLMDHAPDTGAWVDIGTGAGFPGLVIAVLRPEPMWLVEPRRRRAEFLEQVAGSLRLDHVRVIASKAERFDMQRVASVISARAVASLHDLLASGAHLASPQTVWLLPKGRSAQSEVDIARRSWHGVFHVERSETDADAAIVIARGVRSK